METTINNNHGMGNGIAFLFGAVFNLLGNINLSFLLDYSLQAIVGGIICLAFKVLADVLSPLWQKQKERVKDFASVKRVRRFRFGKRKRHAQE